MSELALTFIYADENIGVWAECYSSDVLPVLKGEGLALVAALHHGRKQVKSWSAGQSIRQSIGTVRVEQRVRKLDAPSDKTIEK